MRLNRWNEMKENLESCAFMHWEEMTNEAYVYADNDMSLML